MAISIALVAGMPVIPGADGGENILETVLNNDSSRLVGNCIPAFVSHRCNAKKHISRPPKGVG